VTCSEAVKLAKECQDETTFAHYLAYAAQILAKLVGVDCIVSTTLQTIPDWKVIDALRRAGGSPFCVSTDDSTLALAVRLESAVVIGNGDQIQGRMMVTEVMRTIVGHLLATKRSRSAGSCP
jgi:hypothetical protein